ncbi:MAG: ATP-binding cassette domain-containing protein, partial [Actinomycetota bacterium]|nr:ATP-binding cassette domain-containing protein [Actinomycetota bacterium]
MNAPSVTVGGVPALVARDAAATIGGRMVWRHVDLEVGRGEFVAILGPNGVGKSTLVKAALGLLPLSAGSLEVLGHPPGVASRHIGYLPQRRNFDPGLR